MVHEYLVIVCEPEVTNNEKTTTTTKHASLNYFSQFESVFIKATNE